jgi:tetratricopeptide (TPR) repeat protein
MAISYYHLDAYKAEKKYTDELGLNADKALLYDSKLPESLVAQAMVYIHKKEYKQAEPYLEKALEYNPNANWVLAVLSDFYASALPNTTKYLEYSLMGVRLGVSSIDSVETSYNYLRLGNALAQNGFIEESLKYLDKSLEYNPDNPYSRYVKAFVLYAKEGDLNHTRELLIKEFNKDTTRFDILQDIGKVSYYLGDYQGAYKYYNKFMTMREAMQLDVFKHENLIIALVLEEVGQKEKSEEMIRRFKVEAENNQSIYKDLLLAGYYETQNDAPKAIEHMKLFAKQDNVWYWIILFIDKSPKPNEYHNLPGYKQAIAEIKTRFWNNHAKIRTYLEEKGLL